MEFNLETIIAIVTSITSLGFFAIFKTLIKELKELIQAVKDAKYDNIISEKEMDKIARESMDVIEQVIKIGYLIKRIFIKKGIK